MPARNSNCIEQSEQGYRYSTEPFLLAHFISLPSNLRILDIGTGSGIIPLLLLRRQIRLDITGIEIQKPLFRQAQKNIFTAGASKNVNLVLEDFSGKIMDSQKKQFDLIISNPPYRKLNSGRINLDPVKAIARHEIHLNLNRLLQKSFTLLKIGGHLALAYPTSRLKEVLIETKRHGFSIARVRHIFGHANQESKFFLVEAIKGPSFKKPIEERFIIYRPDGSYSSEMEKVYATFNYSSRSHCYRKE